MKKEIGELLADNGQITPEELRQAQEEARRTGQRLSMVLDRLGLADENQVKNVLELKYGVTYVSLKKLSPDFEAIQLVSEGLITEHEAVPLNIEGNHLTLGMVTPSNQAALVLFRHSLPNWQIKPVVCNEDDFWDFLTRANISLPVPKPEEGINHSQPESVDESEVSPDSLPLDEDEDVEPLEISDDKAIWLISNHILNSAITKGCTNIHIEPAEREVLVHYRKDGILFSARKLPLTLLPGLVSRYKQMAAMNKNDEKLPLDGRLNLQLAGREFSLRLSIVGGAHGEHLIIWLN